MEVYAIAALMNGINSNHDNAEAYISKAKQLSGGQKKKIDTVKVTEQMSAMYFSGICKWEKAEECSQQALDASNQAQDIRAIEECKIFSGTSHYYKGDIWTSIVMTEDAHKSAALRGDPTIQILALCAQARNYFAVANWTKTLEMLSEVKVAIMSSGTLDAAFGEIIYNGIMSMMHLKMNEEDLALSLADHGLERLNNAEPGLYLCAIGYSCIIEVFITLLSKHNISTQKMHAPGRVSYRQKVIAKIEKALELLAKFAQVFPVAQPRAEFMKGSLNWLNGKHAKAEVDWARALHTAKQHSMIHEQAYLLYFKGQLIGSLTDISAATKLWPAIAASSSPVHLQSESSSLEVSQSEINT